jgi:hypothetical protein
VVSHSVASAIAVAASVMPQLGRFVEPGSAWAHGTVEVDQNIPIDYLIDLLQAAAS